MDTDSERPQAAVTPDALPVKTVGTVPGVMAPGPVRTEAVTVSSMSGGIELMDPVVDRDEDIPVEMEERDHLKDYILSKRNKNTVKQTNLQIKKFESWLASSPRCESRPLRDIPVLSMDRYVGSYLLEIKKPDGCDYEPDSLTTIHRSINRKLQEIGYEFDLVRSPEFATSKKVLEARRRELKQLGKGNRPNKSDELTKQEEEKLWESDQLGLDSPSSLLNNVWFSNTKLFGFRGSHESRQLRWGDVSLKNDENGDQFLEFNERETKTRDGNSTHHRSFQPKMFPNTSRPERCPIKAYELYASKRPASMCNPDSPYYLGINHGRKTEGLWYKSQPMGKDKLGCMMSHMAKKAGLVGKKTNHSVRRTMCSRLLHAGVPPTIIQQLSGHKNVQSINNYATASREQQHAMCNILQGNSASVQSPLSPLSIPVSEGTVDWVRSCLIPAGHSRTAAVSEGLNLTALSQVSSSGPMFGLFAGAVFQGNVTFQLPSVPK